MIELKNLLELLDADLVMSHEVAANLSAIASNLRTKYPDFFVAMYVGGSATNGGSVAKSKLQNIDPRQAISDIDYGVILSRQMSLTNRKFLHQDIKGQLAKIGFATCSAFNAEKLYMVADESYNMVRWMLDIDNCKPKDGAQYLASRLLMPFGVVFPFSERKQLQETVNNALFDLASLDPVLEGEIREAMNDILQQRRRIKDKHVPDQEIREYLDQNRHPSGVHF